MASVVVPPVPVPLPAGVSLLAAALGVLEVDWLMVVSVSALAGVMSLLTSVLQYDRKPSSEADWLM